MTRYPLCIADVKQKLRIPANTPELDSMIDTFIRMICRDHGAVITDHMSPERKRQVATRFPAAKAAVFRAVDGRPEVKAARDPHTLQAAQ